MTIHGDKVDEEQLDTYLRRLDKAAYEKFAARMDVDRNFAKLMKAIVGRQQNTSADENSA